MLRLVITLGASVFPFTPVNTSGPYQFLDGVGPIKIAARAGETSGFGATATPNASATLQNKDKRVALLIGCPLRAKAEIYDDATLIFSGTVSEIVYGLTIELTLES